MEFYKDKKWYSIFAVLIVGLLAGYLISVLNNEERPGITSKQQDNGYVRIVEVKRYTVPNVRIDAIWAIVEVIKSYEPSKDSKMPSRYKVCVDYFDNNGNPQLPHK